MSTSEKILGLLARASCRRPWWILSGAAVLTILSLAILPNARITSDILSLLPEELEAVRAFREAEGSFEESRLLFVLVESERPDRLEDLRALAEAWEEALAASPLVERVEFRSPAGTDRFLAEVFSRSFLQYLPPDDVSRVIEALSDDEIRRRVEASRKALRSAPATRARIQYDPLGLWEFALDAALRSAGSFQVDLESGLIITPDHRSLLVTIVGTKPPGDLDYARRLVRTVHETDPSERRDGSGRDLFEGIETHYTGGYLFALGEERTIKRDLGVTIISSLIAVHLLFVLAFRRIRAILFVGLPLILGILWTFAVFILCIGEEMVGGTAAFSAILVGLGIDFAIHYLNRFEAESEGGATLDEAIERAIVRTGRANLAAGLTTAATFGCFLTTRFAGFTQVGFLAGAGILLCLLSMTTVMPALLHIVGRRRDALPLPGFGLGPLGRSVERRPALFLLLALGASAAGATYGAFGFAGIEFETDARKLKPAGDEAVVVQERIEETFGGAFTFVLIVVGGGSEEEVLVRTEALLPRLDELVEDGVIASYSAVTRILPSRTRQARARQRLRSSLPPGRVPAIRRALAEAGFRPEAFEEGLERLDEALGARRMVTREVVEEAGLGPVLERQIRRGERGPVGIVHLFPKANLWDAGSRARWIAAVRERIPPGLAHLTGFVLLSQELAALVQEDLYRAAGLALAAITAIALIHFRNPIPAGLSLLPVVLGATWMVCGMTLFGIKLNYMNMIVFPMILGLGVDDGIHLVARFREGPPRAAILIRGTGRAILLTSLTTLIGFGSLTLATHRGVASIGLVSLIGISTCLATSLFVLPPLLALLGDRVFAGNERGPR